MTNAYAYVISNEKHQACFTSTLLSLSVHSIDEKKFAIFAPKIAVGISCWMFILAYGEAVLNVKFICQLCHMF